MWLFPEPESGPKMSPPNEVRNEDSGSETAELETHSRDRQKDTFWAEVGDISAKLGPSLGHEPETSGRGSGDVSGTSRKHLGETWDTSQAQVEHTWARAGPHLGHKSWTFRRDLGNTPGTSPNHLGETWATSRAQQTETQKQYAQTPRRNKNQ